MGTTTPASPWITTGPFRAAGALGLGRFTLSTVAIVHLAATWFMVALVVFMAASIQFYARWRRLRQEASTSA